MFERELRFYREIAPVVGVRVPACSEATETEAGFSLVLEDLSSWSVGADPVEVARVLADLHRRWEGTAQSRWPWLERSDRATPAIGELYDRLWPSIVERPDATATLVALGNRYVGQVAEIERGERTVPGRTLIHGDASLGNVRTSPDGVIAFMDWEDVRLASGATDLARLLVSSVAPGLWTDVLDAYEPDESALQAALPGAATQGILSLGDQEPGTAQSLGWIARLEALSELIK
jgi:hypothetical protein